ncbi:MAG: hypothetical protein LBU36_03410 [Clostridiales bacterium]|jgi:hypothetical protein|nr:hypothetical protein [Clostridiales bacterium]
MRRLSVLLFIAALTALSACRSESPEDKTRRADYKREITAYLSRKYGARGVKTKVKRIDLNPREINGGGGPERGLALCAGSSGDFSVDIRGGPAPPEHHISDDLQASEISGGFDRFIAENFSARGWVCETPPEIEGFYGENQYYSGDLSEIPSLLNGGLLTLKKEVPPEKKDEALSEIKNLIKAMDSLTVHATVVNAYTAAPLYDLFQNSGSLSVKDYSNYVKVQDGSYEPLLTIDGEPAN